MCMAISAAKGFLTCIYAWGFMYICNMHNIVRPCASLYTCSLACTAENAVYEYAYAHVHMHTVLIVCQASYMKAFTFFLMEAQLLYTSWVEGIHGTWICTCLSPDTQHTFRTQMVHYIYASIWWYSLQPHVAVWGCWDGAYYTVAQCEGKVMCDNNHWMIRQPVQVN